VLLTKAFWYEALHMFLAAYIVAGFVVAGVYAAGMLKGRGDRYHRLGFLIAFSTAAVVMPAQIVVGDIAAREVFRNEPAKFAAIEALPRTASHVPETLGGVLVDGKVRYGIDIPSGASLLAGYHPATRIAGLDAIPPEFRPAPRLVNTVHLTFDVMVGTGFALLALAAWFAVVWWRRRELPRTPWFLRACTLAGVLAVVSLECGWVVTEVGRQPWTAVGVLLTRDAVTTSGNVWYFFAAALVIYAVVGVATVRVLRGMRRRWAAGLDAGESGLPYGPPGPDSAELSGRTR
jgi:cytochrome d ubiquinol oxidase subunit I